MAVLICGGAGYIGSHVNKKLFEHGYETIVLDNLVYGHAEAVKWGDFIKADLKDTDVLERIFLEYPIEAVLHFAAYAYVGESVLEPEKYYLNNVYNTLNLLSVMRRYGCKYIVFSSTCATYGKTNCIPITEETLQHPINPYGASKLMVERILKDFASAYGLRYVVFRYFNAAGADPDGEIGESHLPETHLIPLVLDAASGVRSEIKVFGTDYPTRDGSCVRDYVHVADLAVAHVNGLRYLQAGNESDFFNLGNSKGISVLEIIKTVREITGKEFDVTIGPRRLGDTAVLVGSSMKAEKLLGWKAERSDIRTIVKDAWRWHECKKF